MAHSKCSHDNKIHAISPAMQFLLQDTEAVKRAVSMADRRCGGVGAPIGACGAEVV